MYITMSIGIATSVSQFGRTLSQFRLADICEAFTPPQIPAQTKKDRQG